MRDERGNGTDFWLSPNRSRAWEASLASDEGDDEAAGALDRAPTVFIGFPHASLVCSTCRDVFREPTVGSDGRTRCAGCAPSEGGEAPRADAEAEDAIQSLAVLCRRALRLTTNAGGVSEWTWRADGCGESGIRLRLRDVHDRECAFRPRRCWRPFDAKSDADSRGAKPGRDFCGVVTTKFAYASHAAECEWRAAKCDVAGCLEVVPFCKLAQHALTCPRAIVQCPNKCGWENRRGELESHRTTCEREYIKCGFIDLAREDGAGCLHGCERSAIEAHREECDYRPWRCESCDVSVNAMHASEHAIKCGELRQRCPRCRAMVRAKAFAAHTSHFCMGASKSCAYASFGCLEHGTAEELREHERDSAARHLRLVVKALDAERALSRRQASIMEQMEAALGKFGEEYASLSNKAVERVRFVEMKAVEEVKRLEDCLASNKRAYDEHVTALKAEIKQLENDRAVAVDADAHLAKLDSAISLDEAKALVEASKAEMVACNAQLSKLALAVDASEKQWLDDIETVKAREDEIAERCRQEVFDLVASTSGKDDEIIVRMDALSAEIREISRTLNLDLLGLADKQKELESLWRMATENPQFVRPKVLSSALDVASVPEAAADDAFKSRRRFHPWGDTDSVSDTASERSMRRLGSVTLRKSREASEVGSDVGVDQMRVEDLRVKIKAPDEQRLSKMEPDTLPVSRQPVHVQPTATFVEQEQGGWDFQRAPPRPSFLVTDSETESETESEWRARLRRPHPTSPTSTEGSSDQDNVFRALTSTARHTHMGTKLPTMDEDAEFESDDEKILSSGKGGELEASAAPPPSSP